MSDYRTASNNPSAINEWDTLVRLKLVLDQAHSYLNVPTSSSMIAVRGRALLASEALEKALAIIEELLQPF